MSKIVVIPEFNFQDLIYQIVEFYRKHLDEAIILITTNRLKEVGALNDFSKNVFVVYSQPGLKNAYKTAYKFNALNYNKDIMIINEHDVIPNVNALYSCLHIFENPPIDDVASVSCNYSFNGEYCYPSSPNWFKDKPIISRPDVGKIARIGNQGVPFGFSIWKAKLFENIGDPIFPDTWKLDYHFGSYVHNELGMWHLRLLDYSVEHFNGGVKSWKKE